MPVFRILAIDGNGLDEKSSFRGIMVPDLQDIIDKLTSVEGCLKLTDEDLLTLSVNTKYVAQTKTGTQIGFLKSTRMFFKAFIAYRRQILKDKSFVPEKNTRYEGFRLTGLLETERGYRRRLKDKYPLWKINLLDSIGFDWNPIKIAKRRVNVKSKIDLIEAYNRVVNEESECTYVKGLKRLMVARSSELKPVDFVKLERAVGERLFNAAIAAETIELFVRNNGRTPGQQDLIMGIPGDEALDRVLKAARRRYVPRDVRERLYSALEGEKIAA